MTGIRFSPFAPIFMVHFSGISFLNRVIALFLDLHQWRGVNDVGYRHVLDGIDEVQHLNFLK